MARIPIPNHMSGRFKRRIVLVICVCSLHTLMAQKNSFHPGYIIEQGGDTIQGRVKDRSPEPFVALYNKIRFRKADRSWTKRYGPEDILGYGYQGQHFVSVPFREESTFFKFRYYTDAASPRIFLKVINRSEQLVYFEQLFVHDDNSYVDSIPFFYRPGRKDLVRVTQGIFGFRKKRLTAYFSDCPEFIEEINRDRPSVRTVWELYGFYVAHCTK